MFPLIKVCHFTSVHPSLDTRIFVKQCCSLAEAGFEVNLVVANAVSEVRNSVNIIGVKSNASSRIVRFIKTGYIVYKAAKNVNADIYHFHDPELLFWAYLLKRKGKTVVYDVHEDLPRQILTKHYIPLFLRKLVSFIAEKTENMFAASMSAIVTVTTHIQKRFLNVNKNSIILFNYPLLSEFSSEISNATDRKYVSYVGSLSVTRGILEMVRVVAGGNFKITIAGDFADKNLFDKVRTRQGWNKINYLGQVSRAEVASLLSESIVGLVTLHPTANYTEALPVKLFEYMASGIPVICSDIKLWRELIEKADCGVCVDPFDVAAIRSAIEYYLNNPAIAYQKGINGRRAVEKYYNWGLEKDKLTSLYMNLLKK